MRTLIEAVLTESRHEEILDSFIKAFDDSFPNEDRARETLMSERNSEAAWAKRVLKKADRITWFFKLVRMEWVNKFETFAIKYPNSNYAVYQKKLRNRYAQEVGSDELDYYNIPTIQHKLEHYLSLPIYGIQNYQFRNQSFEQVDADFSELEVAWQKEASGSLEAQIDDDIVLDFHNGWVWMLLNRAHCEAEAKAMGHCGNSPRKDSGDRILSLRKQIETPNGTRWSPHCTFILRDDGMLTEMKGRANDKPVAKYHPMIIALLKLPLIKGIVGGGYMPQNNFSLADLDDEQRMALMEECPKLMNAYWYGHKHGVDDHFRELVGNEYHTITGRSLNDVEDNVAIHESWDSLRAFINASYLQEIDPVTDIWNYDFSGGLMMLESFGDLEDYIHDVYVDVRKTDDMTTYQFIERFHDVLERARKRVMKVCERKAEKYIIDWIERQRLAVDFLSFRVSPEKRVEIISDAMELASALDTYESGDQEEPDYWGIESICREGPFTFPDHDDPYEGDDVVPVPEFVTNLTKQVKSFWERLLAHMSAVSGEHQLSLGF